MFGAVAAVAARLRPLLPAGDASADSEEVRLVREADALHIALYTGEP
jgi:hypothetical protein